MPERPRILLVEDEKSIADILLYALDTDGFKTDWVGTGGEALAALERNPADLAIVDIGLPDLSGFELFTEIRRRHPIPVIFLTARGSEIDRVSGLEMGADDYVVKPFSNRELMLRIKAVLRRAEPDKPADKIIKVGDITIDTGSHVVTSGGEEVVLTTTEYKLLLNLAERLGRVQNRDLLLKNVWGYNYVGDTRTVDTHITRLRTKLGAAGDLIKTVRGFGYKMEAS